MSNNTFDLVIIGSGPGGYETAIHAAQAGLTVALIEKAELGGTCLNCGCIPTKALYQSGKILRDLKKSSEFGISTALINFDLEIALGRKNQVVEQLKKNISQMLQQVGVTVFQGVGSFYSESSLKIANGENEKFISYKHCIIATGSKEVRIPIPGVDLPGVFSSKEFLNHPTIPEKLVIIGGGVIGCEFASIYNEFGSQVTIIEALDQILSTQDEDIASRLRQMMKRSGIQIETQTKVVEIKQGETGLEVICENKKGQIIHPADVVLLAVGRKAFIEDLNLSEVGIEYNWKGIVVNDQYQTTKPNVYAVGDCIGGMMLAHTATFQSLSVLDQILNRENKTNFQVVPACIFTYPEIASVGLTEKEAALKHDQISVKKTLYRANGKANAMGSVDGFIKVIKHGDELVGVHIIGEGASTIIHEASLILANGMKISECVAQIHAHPTLSEILLDALRS